MLKVLEVALGEVGYLEKSRAAYNADPTVIFEQTKGAGYDNLTKYAYYMDAIPGWYNGSKQGFSWCNVFTDWCFYRAYGISKAEHMTNHTQLGASVGWSADAYKAMGRLFYKNPKPGDQVYFGYDYDNLTHTGLIYDVDDDYIYTVEGNTSSAPGVESNGGGVFKKRYSRYSSYVCCFGRPLYTNESEDDDMTGEEIYKKLTEYMNSRAIPEGMRAEYQEAIDMGITDGSRPMGLCTRIESTLITKRAIDKKVK